MKKKEKFNPHVYLYAAELQAQYQADTHLNRYSCDNIASTVVRLILGERDFFDKKHDDIIESYQDLYALYFKPIFPDNFFGWWPDSDNESRIIALLLMYEIAKDLNRKMAKKKSNKKHS